MESGRKKIQVEMVPSEDGWGYMICVGFTLSFTVCMCHANSFGIMFNDFLKESNESSSILTSVYGITGIMISLSGYIVNIAKKRYSLRQISIFGSICYSLCWLLDTFITNVFQMMFTNGFLNGIGWGIVMATGYTSFNSYFIEKRVMMMGICMSIVGLGSIFFPFFVEYSLDMYGYRGTMALVGAITANSIVGSALFHPAEWHLVPKIIYHIGNEGAENVTEKDSQNIGKNIKCIANNVDETTIHNEQSVRLMSVVLEEIEDQQMFNGSDDNNPKIDKIDITPSLNENNGKTMGRGIFVKLADHLELRLLQNFSFFNVNLASALGLFCDLQFYMLQPLLLFEYGFTTSEVATCVSITSIADLASRVSMAIVSHFFTIRSRYLSYASLIGSTIARFVFLQFTDFTGVAIMTATLGVFRGWFYVSVPIMCADVLTVDQFAAGYALTFLTTGILNSMLAPISGVIRDLTGSYVAAFYFFACSSIVVIVFWTYEFFILNQMSKKT